MSAGRIYADFQDLDDANRLRLACVGTLRDLEARGIRLRDGLVLAFYSDDLGRPDELRAEGVVRRDEAQACWVAEVDWGRLHHASDEAPRSVGRESA